MSEQGETLDGAEIRRRIMGDAWVHDANAGEGDALDHFTEMSIEHVWRNVWPRAGLQLRLRSVVTISVLAALESPGELKAHIAGALRNGLLTPVEVREILLHTTPYIGWPRARHAIEAAKDLLANAEHSDTSPIAEVGE